MAAAAEPLIPHYATDENAKPGFVRVSVIVPELKTRTKFSSKGLKQEPSHARVSVDMEEWSLLLSVWLDARKSQKNRWYELKIRRLIKPINKDGSYYEIKEGRVLLYLKKLSPESWNPELQCGLDGFEEDDVLPDDDLR